MASPLDILLRVKGDSSDAVRAVQQVGTEAEKTAAKVSTIGSKLRAGLAGGLGALGSALAGGAIGGTAADFAGQQLDALTGAAGKISKGLQNLQFAGSGQDLARAFTAQAVNRAESYSESGGIFGNLRNFGVNLYRNVTGGNRPLTPSEEREAKELFQELARTDPTRATVLLQQNLGRAEYLRAGFAQTLLAANQGRSYSQQIGNLPVTNMPGQMNINVYTGVGDKNAIGRDVAAAYAAYQRNNGTVTSTFTRR